MPPSGPPACERARAWSSLAVDGELSPVEALLLERHLDACLECAEFDARLRTTTSLLRTAPAEKPSRPLVPDLPQEPALPRRRVVAVLVAAAMALGVFIGTLERPEPRAPAEPTEISFLDPAGIRDREPSDDVERAPAPPTRPDSRTGSI